MLAKKIEILPGDTQESITPYGHIGEEFVYVLSGRLTLILEDEVHTLYPRDCAHYKSERLHNWANNTRDVVEILVVSTPNPFKDEECHC
jgi:uncharacterized cupin superfamily protein